MVRLVLTGALLPCVKLLPFSFRAFHWQASAAVLLFPMRVRVSPSAGGIDMKPLAGNFSAAPHGDGQQAY